MTEDLVNALSGETVVHSNALATVTRNCVVIRDGFRGAQAIISIDTITGLRKVTTTRPGLIVVSCGLFVMTAASYVSKQGWEVVGPIAVIACLFILGYIGTRRAAVLFLMEREKIESIQGSYREATSVIRAVERMRKLSDTESDHDQSISPDAVPNL
jgi:hypothetical protein